MKTLELLRKKDLHPRIGVPKSTVADWIEDFNIYIPKVKQENVTYYYKPEALDVLWFIKQCREQDYQKNQIMEMLSERGFPIAVQEAVEDVKKILEGDIPRDTLLTVMQTTAQMITKIAEQDKTLKDHNESLKTLQDKQDVQEERLSDLERQANDVNYLKQEFKELKQEVEIAKEKKGFFAKLFGK